MSTSFISLGRYIPGSSPIHLLDARAKLLAAFVLACGVVWSRSLTGQLAVAGFLLLSCALARLPWQLLWRTFLGALWLLAFVVAANVLWLWISHQVTWATRPVGIESLPEFLVLLARLGNLLLLAILFTGTTVPVDAAEGLQSLLRPLGRLRLPVHELALLLSLSLSFIPIFLEEARNLSKAHRVKRGMARWRWRDRMSAAVPLLVPLFLTVLRRSDELAVAMESRCYVPGRSRTSLVPHRTGGAEWLLLGACGLLLILLILS